MKRLEDIPIRLDLDRVEKELRLENGKNYSRDLLEIMAAAESFIRPRAAFKVCLIQEREPSAVTVDGIRFTSRVLAENLANTDRIFPYIITIGKALEDRARSANDLLIQFCLETMGDVALHQAREFLEKHLKKNYGLGNLSSLSPGSLIDWPTAEQKLLFSLLGGKSPLGVRLTGGLLMIPRKSISGIFFPTETGFYSCQLCPREKCSGRKAADDKSLRKKYGLEDAEADEFGK